MVVHVCSSIVYLMVLYTTVHWNEHSVHYFRYVWENSLPDESVKATVVHHYTLPLPVNYIGLTSETATQVTNLIMDPDNLCMATSVTQVEITCEQNLRVR